jgi:glycosyltransferase involved in cell wall biosynthesis
VKPGARTVVLAANSSWNLAHFRGGLIRGLKAAGYTPIAIAPEDPRGDARLAELGIEQLCIRLDRSGLNPFGDLGSLLRYRRLLGRMRPAAFLGFTVKPNIYGSMAAGSLGIPVIANVSGLGTAFIRPGPLQQLVSSLYRIAFKGGTTVFFQNPDDRQLFVDRRIVRQAQTALVPGSGVDLDWFAPAPQPAGPLTFLLIARLLTDKGVREYVEAARTLRSELPAARFQLLGGLDPGNRTAVSRAELQSWIDERVIDYLGEREDVRPHIAQATAVVLPSYREGLPRTLLEAAAMARPLVATDVPGCREVVEQGVNGCLCAARNSISLAKAMKQVAELSPEQREQMGRASRSKVQEQFSEALVVDRYLDALAQLATLRV